jgi:nucleoredoxin
MLYKLIGTTPIMRKAGGVIKINDLLKESKAVGVYFSGSWCPPCKQFTPVLIDYYDRANKVVPDGGKNFNIVFASVDRSYDEFNAYWGKMPWDALPFGH